MALIVQNLSRKYTKGNDEQAFLALDAVSFEVGTGSVVSMLGPNGAGKTTLLRIASTVLSPTSGSLSIFGVDVVDQPREVRRLVALVAGGEKGLFPHLTAYENLLYWAALLSLPHREAERRVDAALAIVDLHSERHRQVRGYSRGMKQRVHIARGLLSDARLLLFDEPTNALDPVTAHSFRALVGSLAAEGRTVLLASHDMGECEAISDKVVLMRAGRVLAFEKPSALAKVFDVNDALDFDGRIDGAVGAVQRVRSLKEIRRSPRSMELQRAVFSSSDGAVRGLSELLSSGIEGGRIVRATLEEVYLSVYGGSQQPTDSQNL